LLLFAASESFSQSSSTSCCVSQFTKSDIAGEKVKCGSPFSDSSGRDQHFEDELAGRVEDAHHRDLARARLSSSIHGVPAVNII
jgi:hypothetical protein